MSVVALGQAVWWAVLFGAAVVVGRLTALPETGLALFWPAAGVAALWILRAGPAVLVPNLALVFVTTVVVNQADGVAPVPSMVFGVANLVVALSVRAVLARSWARQEPGDPARPGEVMGSTEGVIALARAAVLAGVASAPLGVLAGYLITDSASVLGAVAWAVRNATGVFVVAGVVLAVAAALRARAPGTSLTELVTTEPRSYALAEMVVTTAVTAVVSWLVFVENHGLPLAFLMVAIAAFVGFRFSPVASAVLTTGVGTVAVVATVLERGPFGAIDNPLTAALVVQSFVLVQAAISLTLSWAVKERRDLAVALVAAKEEADERAQLLDAVTDRLEYGVAVIDTDGRFLVRNTAAEAMVPGPQTQITGESQPGSYGVWRADGEPMDLSSMPHAIALATGDSVAVGLVVRREAVPDTFVNVRADPLELTGRHARRVAVVSMRDDTAHQRQVEGLETFAGAVAHDLRNPLAAMTSWAELLARHLKDQDTHDEGAEEALGRIAVAGHRMSNLIDDLLSYATASSAPLTPEVIDLAQLVDELSDEIIAASDLTPPPSITCGELGMLTADLVLIRQVLANVLANAVKYTAGGVQPLIRVSADHTSVGTEIRITDNGVGIPEDMRTVVFEGFTRIVGAPRRPGIGLGLAICARAVERHHGSIEIGPAAEGTGSTVTLTLPHWSQPASEEAS